MTDRYASFANSGPGKAVVKRLGLPAPPPLRRYRPGEPALPGPALLGTAPGGRLERLVRELLPAAGITVLSGDPTAADHAGPAAPHPEPEPAAAPPTPGGTGALVFDATGITDPAALRAVYDFFHPRARALAPGGRVVVLGTPPAVTADPAEASVQRALEGFVRSVGKEFGRGSTAQLVAVPPGAEDTVEATLRFLLSARSAYVSGQVITHSLAAVQAPADWERPLAGMVAVVTGAARGIGAAITEVLARDGAHVIAVDIPGAGDALARVANAAAGTALQLDITADDAPHRLAEHVAARHGRLDIIVHNAGITRDKTLARMADTAWESVLAVNLTAPQRLTDGLLKAGVIGAGGRIIGVSSIAGLAGNRGQTNYAASKAGVAGWVGALAPTLAHLGITVNAVAPGFIETAMTAKVPLLVREAGRRMNSLAQGGLPVDVAETIAWLASPASSGVTGNVVRVCGQSLLGA